MTHLKIAVLMALFAALLVAPAVSQEAPAKKEATAASGVWKVSPKEGGWEVTDLLEMLKKETGASVVYDSNSPQIRGRKIQFKGEVEVPRERIFAWLQALLSFHRLILVPVGAEESNCWALYDLNSPQVTSRPIYVQEDEIDKWADRDGVYVVTTVSLKHLTDTSRARNALAQLSTRQIGRINDVPGANSFVIGDFAPVVASMKQLLTRMDQDAKDAPVQPAPSPRAPTGYVKKPDTKSETRKAIERYEQLLADSQTSNAAQYFLGKIALLQATLDSERTK